MAIGTLIQIYLMAWNKLLECRDALVPEWEEAVKGDDLLVRFRVMDPYGVYERGTAAEGVRR